MKKSVGISVCVVILAGVYLLVQAGEMEPPGPPAPTMKTLDQVEPRTPIHAADLPLTITEPGSYYLAEDIVTTGDGIKIATDNVTIDLMGFRLEGGTGSGIDAYFDSIPKSNITVKNGTVAGWGGVGVQLDYAGPVVVKNVTAVANDGWGIRLAQGRVIDCRARDNGANGPGGGIFVRANGNVVTGCSATNNQDEGFLLEGGDNLIDRCVASGNRASGFDVGRNSVVSNCLAMGNQHNGFRIDSECYVTRNNSNFNLFFGFLVHGDLNRIEANHALGSEYGFRVSGIGNITVRNSASGQTYTGYWHDSGNYNAGTCDLSGTPNAWCNIHF